MTFRHLTEKQLTYTQHLKQAWGYAFELGVLTAKLLVHGIWPDWFAHDASDKLEQMVQTLNR